jgi:hypothetical protein
MNKHPDHALTPDAFDYASCRVCGGPTVIPLTWTMAGSRLAVHQVCYDGRRALIVGEEETEELC